MIVSGRPIRVTPRWLRVSILSCTVVLLPLGVAYAGGPDYDAVAKRLVDAVMAGEMSADDAEAMMAELGRSAFERQLHAARKRKGPDARDRQFRDRLRKLVEAGMITEADARAKRHAYEKSKGAPKRERPSKDEMARVKKEIWAGVESGLMTEAQAKERWESYLDHFKQPAEVAKIDEDERKRRYVAGEREIKAAVKAGTLSEADADKRLIALRKYLWGGGRVWGRGERKVDPRDAEVRRALDKRVKAGHISEADAKKRWEEYEKSKGAGAKGERGERKIPTREEMAAVKKKIWASVESGRITEEQAQERWAGYLQHVRDSAAKRAR